jgi:hypothetical protein
MQIMEIFYRKSSHLYACSKSCSFASRTGVMASFSLRKNNQWA